MPGRVWAVPGVNSIYAMYQASPLWEDRTILWDIRYPNGNRGLTTMRQWFTVDGGLWPQRGRMGFYSDPAAPCSLVFGNDEGCDASGDWSPWIFGLQGTASQKFIIGTCLDSLSATVSGAIVQIFRTSDDLYVGETTSDSNGRYEAGTPWAGIQHYLVAYRAGSPDIAGTTVNTLVPTNRDGT